MIRRRLAVATLLLPLAAAAIPAVAADEPLGRLFFTPERRASLDRARQLNIAEQQQVTQGDIVTVDGMVTRSSGRHTTWVNGVAFTERNATPSMRIQPTDNPAAVRIAPSEQPPTTVTIGTSVNRTTGEHIDGLLGGKITVRPGRPAMSGAPR